MRAFSTDLKTGTAAEATHLGWLLALTPVTLAQVFLSTIGANYTYSANVYLGDPGFVMGNARITDGSDPATLEVEIPVSDDGPVTPDNVTAGMYQGAVVVLRMVDYVNDDVSPPIGFKWVVGATRITDDGKAVFEIRAATRVNRELVLKTFGPLCPYDWGGARCGVTAATFTDTVEVASVTSLHEITVTGTLRANGFFDNGGFKFTTGGLAGRSFTVRKYTLATGQILFWERLPVLPAIGDDATVHAGCDKTRGAAGCTKFSSIARFGGFADMPPDDAKFAFEGELGGGPTQPVVTEPDDDDDDRGWYQWTTGRWIR